MSTSSFDHPLDDIAVYAVGALERDDARALEAHLATCAVCQAELAAHHEALALLVVDEEPPPGLWDRVVANLPDDLPDARSDGTGDDLPAPPGEPGAPPVPGRIEIRPRALRTPDEPPPLRPVPPPPTTPPPPAPDAPTPAPPGDAQRGPGGRDGSGGPGGTGGRVGPLHLAGRPRRQRFARAVVAAAAAVVLVAASVAATLAISGDDDGNDEPPTEVAAPTSDELAQAAADDPTGVAQLANDAGQPQARLVNSDDGSFVFFDELPTLPSGRSYQLWSLDSGTPVSLGVLGDGSGEAVAVAVPPSTVQVAISDAPAAGEPQPTGPIVATGAVQAV